MLKQKLQKTNRKLNDIFSPKFIQTLDKDGDNTWTKTNETNEVDNREIILTGLTPMHRYRFRVKAENDGGLSNSVETRDITTKQDPGNCLQ